MREFRSLQYVLRGRPNESGLLIMVLSLASFITGCAGVVASNGSSTPPPSTSAVTITNVQAIAPTTSGFQVGWKTNVPANSQIEYGASAAYGSSTPVNPTNVTSHQVVLSGLVPSTLYHYRVHSTDANNNAAVSNDSTFSTLSASTVPTVSVISPAAGSTVSGTVSVTADATSHVGVASVQFQLDGANIGAAVTTAPYSYTWDTANSTNGMHTLKAVAKDTAVNSAASAGDQVTVNNTPVASSVPSKDPAGIFDGKGNFDANAYVQMAKEYGTPAMIAERFGNPWTAYHASISAPKWWQPPSQFYDDATNPSQKFFYSLGIPCGKDDYSTTYAQVAYVTDSNVSGSIPGVDGVATLERDHCLWAGLPQSYWATGSRHPTFMLRPDNVKQFDPYGMPQQPVEVTRAYGASEAAGCSYMVFQDGQVACGEGGNTAEDAFYIKPFPANFTPTAASVTNNGEFLLVTGWNTDTYRGELAVLAMGGAKPTGTFWDYEWNEIYPGFRNYSLPKFSKLLGIIDLSGMVAPTAIEAVGNCVYEPGAFLPVAAGQSRDSGQPGRFSLSNQANWQCFVNGECASLYDTAGFAVIASRYERTVLIVDLGPLFRAIRKGMFSSWSQFRANVANTGNKAGQWPPTFVEDPSETPTIAKTINFSHQVTAISASLYPDNRALVATEDGHVHVWDVDGLQTADGSGMITKEIDDLQGIGSNVTRIAHMKHWLKGFINGGEVRWQYIALARGDKTVKWIDLSGTLPTIVRTLQDSRLVDPIAVEDNNNHGTQTELIDIADYGDANVKGYRYGQIIFWTTLGIPSFGMGATGKDAFEYEGAYATPTGPFAISAENVP